MPSAASTIVRSGWVRQRGLIVPGLMAASILVVVVPVPAALLDLLLSANIALAVLILLTTLYVGKPLEFSVFPSLLLAATLARLVLNVAATRLILTQGGLAGADAAGGVIRAFGDFVAGGHIAVGLIIFSILVAVQFLVITKGATRISEVAARFALDGLPGRQMAIDADVQAGLIDARGASQRREELGRQADFYAAMDGAGKFVRGDAMAGLIIILINIVGGMYMGLVEHGMPLGEAARAFTRLTIGDGLVTQIPAFLISLAAGMLVTRSSVESDLPGDMVGQMLLRPEAMGVAAVFLAALAFAGLPRLPLLLLAAALAALGLTLSRAKPASTAAEGPPPVPEPSELPAVTPEDHLRVAPLELELGYRLIRLADRASGGDLLERVMRVRHKMAQELGLIIPTVRIHDNIRLGRNQYQIRIQDVPVAWGDCFPEELLAIDAGATHGPLQGVPAAAAVFGRKAVWIETAQRQRAEEFGWQLVEPIEAVVAHLTETVQRHSDELLSRQQVHQLLDHLKLQSPRVVEELVPDLLKPAQVHQVLCNLLHERVPIRNLETILETLGEHADCTKDPGLLTEFVRQALSRVICQQYRDRNRVLRVVTLDPAVEDLVASGVDCGERGLLVQLAPRAIETIVQGIANALDSLTTSGFPPVLLAGPQIRAAIKQITASALPALAVLTLREITRDTHVESVGQVRLDLQDAEAEPVLMKLG